jgi:hypothetical protein
MKNKISFGKACILMVTWWFTSQNSYSQITVYNDGMAVVSIAPTATVSIMGNYISKTNTGTDGKIDNQGTLQLTGNWTNNNSNTVPYNAFSSSAGTVVFMGTGKQTIGGTAITPFYNLTINNDPSVSGDVTLSTNNYIVSNNLNLILGNIDLNGHTLTLGTGTATPGTLTYPATAGFLYGSTGTFTRWISATAAAMGSIASNSLGHFPVGSSAGDYRPVWIAYATDLAAGGTVSVSHVPSYPSGTSSVSHTDGAFGTLQGVSNSLWNVSTANSFAISGSNNGSIRFGGTGLGTFVLSDLDATLASSVVGTYAAATNLNTSLEVNRTALSTANLAKTWYIGSKNIVVSPLPVQFLSFKAQPDHNQVEINWATGAEFNNAYFIVQRSKDQINFEDIAQVNGAGTNSTTRQYSAFDTEPYSGTSFYRLKQVDFNDAFSFSNTISVEFHNDDAIVFNVYPTISSGDFHVSFSGKQGQRTTVVVRNMWGQDIYSAEIFMDKNELIQPVSLPGIRVPGLYTVIASASGSVFVRSIVIR